MLFHISFYGMEFPQKHGTRFSSPPHVAHASPFPFSVFYQADSYLLSTNQKQCMTKNRCHLQLHVQEDFSHLCAHLNDKCYTCHGYLNLH